MAKITGIYKITLPNIPMNITEIPKQRPIIINTDVEQIKIYPPGYNCEKVCKRMQGKNLRVEIGVAHIENPDSFYILIEKEGYASNTQEAETEYEKLDTEVEKLAFKIMRLFRKKLPKTPIAIPNQLQYKSLCKCDSESLKNTLWSRTSRDNTVIYTSSQYYLDRQKWSALRKAIQNDIDTEIWEDFLYDAYAALELHDFTKAIIYAAVACEVFIKNYTEEAKEGVISKDAWDRLKNRRPRVLEYYDSILHLVTNHSLNIEQEDLYKSMQQLFVIRNQIMHEGKTYVIQEKDETIKDIIRKAESTIAWVSGIKVRSKFETI
jgi:hypothetical protein